MDKRKFKSYCGNEEDYSEYVEYLNTAKECFKEGAQYWKNLVDKRRKPYTDPDGTYRRKSHPFYTNIISFLNIQKKEKIFNFTKYGIKVKINNKILTIRSDQLGFGAPKHIYRRKTKKYIHNSWDTRYPYAYYILKGGETKKVADYIWDSRTLGGSFLWPTIPYRGSVYNTNRGVGGYIYDRADLTLLEIKKFYKFYKNNKDPKIIQNLMISSNCILMKDDDYIEIYNWLSYFESFKKYVDFFCFREKDGKENFVNSNYEVLSLVTNEPIKDGHSEKGIDEMDLKEIEAILKNTHNHIINRTEIIEGIIYGETNKK